MPETIDGHKLSTFLPVAVNTGLGPNRSISDIKRFFSIIGLLVETFEGILVLNFVVGVYPVLAVCSQTKGDLAMLPTKYIANINHVLPC